MEDGRAELEVATTEVTTWPAEEIEGRPGYEAEASGGRVPVIVTVFASTTVLVTVIVEVETVVKVSSGLAKVSVDEERNKRVLRAKLRNRIVM